jgi:hypothetical protein
LDAIIEQDLTIIPGNSFNLTYKGATISLVMSGAPPEPALSVSNTMVLTLDYIGADDLYLIGTIKTETESLTAAYTLQQSPGSDSVWHPFGYSQLSVGALAIQFGGTYLAPWIDNFGIAAQDLTIGSVSGSLAILIDTNDPDQFVFYMQTDHITLLELISCLSPLTFIAYQALPNSITNALEKVIDVSLSDVEISIVPAATQIGELVFEDEGINAKGTLSAWGWEATADISVSTSEIDIYAEMEPLRLSVGSVELFSIEGAQGDENATYSLYIGTEEIPEFYMSVSVTLLGVRNEVYASLDESGLKFILEYSATYLSYSLSTILDETKLYVSGSMDFVLNMSVTLPVLGKLRLVDVSLAAEATLQIDSAFYLHLAGSFNFYGAGFSLTVTVNEALPNFTAVFDALVDYIEDNAEEIFKELFNTLSEWADAVADGAVWFAGSVADVAKDAYGLGEDAVDAIIDASQTIGDGAVKIAEGMKDAYNWSEKKVANALQDAGYAVEEVANALVDAYSATEKVVATALKAAGYTATQIANGLADAYNTSVTAVAGVLEDLGYSATAVAKAVEDAFNATSTEVAKALKAAGYTIDEITNALDSAFNTTAEGIASALKAAGYAVDEVGDALMDAFDMTEDALEDALKGAGYAAKEVGNWLDDTFNPSKW